MIIRVFEAFSGVGSQRMALRDLGINHEVVATSDVDEFTVKSYAAIHSDDKTVPQVTDEEMQDFLEKRNIPLNDKGVRKILKGNKLREFYEACIKSNNLGDISKVVTQDIPDHDLFTYSFPCQDISVAGDGLGLDEGSGTRSGLLWECQKIIAGKKPKYLLLENVKNLVGKRHKPNFDKWLEWLEEQGYANYWQVLNAKDYGVPQNRERVFVVSILGEHEPYKFPEPVELELRLKDVLEVEVDEKFYLDTDKSKKLIATITDKHDIKEAVPTLDTMQGNWRQSSVIVDDTQGFEDTPRIYKDYAPSLRASRSGLKTVKTDSKDVVIGASRGRNPENTSDRSTGSPTEQRLEINKQGTSNTITTVQKDDYVVEGISDKFSFVKRKSREIIAEKGRLPKYYNPYNKSETTDVAPTITTNSDRASNSGQVMINKNFRIRKLTPKECWRLMGFSDEDFHKAEEVNSASQLYKQAGNSIVVDVLEGIFKQLLEEK